MLNITSGNCLPLEFVPIVAVPSQCTPNDVNQYSVKITNTSTLKSRIKDETTKVPAENYYIYIRGASRLSMCSNKIVAYIEGFVVHSLGTAVNCTNLE